MNYPREEKAMESIEEEDDAMISGSINDNNHVTSSSSVASDSSSYLSLLVPPMAFRLRPRRVMLRLNNDDEDNHNESPPDLATCFREAEFEGQENESERGVQRLESSSLALQFHDEADRQTGHVKHEQSHPGRRRRGRNSPVALLQRRNKQQCFSPSDYSDRRNRRPRSGTLTEEPRPTRFFLTTPVSSDDGVSPPSSSMVFRLDPEYPDPPATPPPSDVVTNNMPIVTSVASPVTSSDIVPSSPPPPPLPAAYQAAAALAETAQACNDWVPAQETSGKTNEPRSLSTNKPSSLVDHRIMKHTEESMAKMTLQEQQLSRKVCWASDHYMEDHCFFNSPQDRNAEEFCFEYDDDDSDTAVASQACSHNRVQYEDLEESANEEEYSDGEGDDDDSVRAIASKSRSSSHRHAAFQQEPNVAKNIYSRYQEAKPDNKLVGTLYLDANLPSPSMPFVPSWQSSMVATSTHNHFNDAVASHSNANNPSPFNLTRSPPSPPLIQRMTVDSAETPTHGVMDPAPGTSRTGSLRMQPGPSLPQRQRRPLTVPVGPKFLLEAKYGTRTKCQQLTGNRGTVGTGMSTTLSASKNNLYNLKEDDDTVTTAASTSCGSTIVTRESNSSSTIHSANSTYSSDNTSFLGSTGSRYSHPTSVTQLSKYSIRPRQRRPLTVPKAPNLRLDAKYGTPPSRRPKSQQQH